MIIRLLCNIFSAFKSIEFIKPRVECSKGLYAQFKSDLTIPMNFSRARNFAAARKTKKTGLQRTYFW